MSGRVRIVYREFYDVPRMFILNHRGLKLLLDSPFDDVKDEYSPSYRVYVLPKTLDEQRLPSWEALAKIATRCLGEIPVDRLRFDPTKRADIDCEAIDSLLDSGLAKGGEPEA